MEGRAIGGCEIEGRNKERDTETERDRDVADHDDVRSVRALVCMGTRTRTQALGTKAMTAEWPVLFPENGGPGTLLGVLVAGQTQALRDAAAVAVMALLEGARAHLALAADGCVHQRSRCAGRGNELS